MSCTCLLANPNFLYLGMLLAVTYTIYVHHICMMLDFAHEALQGKVYGRLVLLDGWLPALDSHAIDHALSCERCYMRRHRPLCQFGWIFVRLVDAGGKAVIYYVYTSACRVL